MGNGLAEVVVGDLRVLPVGGLYQAVAQVGHEQAGGRCPPCGAAGEVLHQPTVRVKELAAQSGVVSYESALQELFGLKQAEPSRSAAVDLNELPEADIVALGTE